MSPRHPEVAEPQPNRSMQDLECYPAFGSSGSIHLSSKGKSLREKQTLIDSGSESGMTQDCHAELVSASSHCDDEGSPLTPTLSRRARGKRVAFTLAEVLITLAIIGVVATLTIPNLVANYEKRVTEVRLQKAYASLSQLLRLAKVDHGPVKNWDLNLSSDAAENTKLFAESYILPYLKGVSYCDEGYTEGECAPYVGCGYASQNYKLADGSMLGICAYADSIDEISLLISPRKDINRFHSRFDFALGRVTGNFRPGYYDPQYTREDYLNGIHIEDPNNNDGEGNEGYTVACNPDTSIKYNTHACTALIFVDGFKIKDDYPW